VLSTRTGSGGNPLLQPLTVNQADIALEWYPNSTSMLYGTLFYKKVKDFQGTTVVNQAFDVPGRARRPSRSLRRSTVTKARSRASRSAATPSSTSCPIRSTASACRQTSTYVDSKAPSLISFDANGRPLQTPLQGLSKWSYNLVGFYEKSGVTARVAYNWRDDYLDTVNGNGTGAVAIYRHPYGQLDASLSYDFTHFFTATIDGVNLLRERKDSYQAVPEHPRTLQLEDRRIGISFRFKI
jgi:TonB-dependent receptor